MAIKNMGFAATLKNLRLAKQIGQQKLASDLHFTVKSISHWETGYSEPSIAQLILLADYFDVSVDELIGREFRHT